MPRRSFRARGHLRHLVTFGSILIGASLIAGCFRATHVEPASRLGAPTAPGTHATAAAAPADHTNGSGEFHGDHFDRVLIIVLENQNFGSVMKNAYMNRLADEGACFTRFRGLAHPSYPNYLALITGRLYHTKGDHQQDVRDDTLAETLTAANLTWKNYAEGFPGGCFACDRRGRYVRKHVPFMSVVSVRHAQCERVVDGRQFHTDLAAGAMPNYAFYSPDVKNDGHDTGIAYSSKWLKGFLEPFRHDPDRTKGLLIVVTYDESKNDPPGDPNHIYTVFLGDMVKPGRYPDAYNHFNLLRTIEDNFHLPVLAAGDGGARSINGVWSR
jgi:hypothetical protein